ncbi:MAG: DUF4143 domain-containing protein [Sphaerochaeta sp.]|nr:DUF4143 domain-containing protein [Sphaerochaeta sp.]
MVKTPKIYFCDIGFAAHLLGIRAPAQMNRDSHMGNLFENMIVMEAVKARYNAGKSNQLYFFRNSNGLEVDLLLGQQRKLIPKDPDDTAEVGLVIYSGESVDRFKGYAYRNFHDCAPLFEDNEPPFTVSF